MRSTEATRGTVRTGAGREIELHSRVGEGGEGSVFHIGGSADEVAKLYNEKVDAEELAEKAQKLSLLVRIENENLRTAAAWPTDVVLNEDGAVIGFTMEFLTGYQPLFMAYQIKTRLKMLSGRDYGFLVRLASNLAACVHFVHDANLVIGDLNESNVLVTAGARVKLIDADSFQLKTESGYLTPGVGKTELLPPELQGKSLDGLVRKADEDNFSLAVLIFQTLVFGRHPFAGRPKTGDDIALETAIEHGWYVFAGDPKCPLEPPRNIDLAFLPPQIRTMFVDAFTPGRQRPTAAEWHIALRKFDSELKDCPKSSSHLYWKGAEVCPWCGLETQLGLSLFAVATVKKRDWGAIDFDAIEKEIEAASAPSLEPALPDPDRYLTNPVRLPWWEHVIAIGAFKNLSFIYLFATIQIYKSLSSVAGLASGLLIALMSMLFLLFLTGVSRPIWLRHRMGGLSRKYQSLRDQWQSSASNSLFERKKDEYRELVRELRTLDSRREELRRNSLRLKYGHLLDRYLARYSIAIADIPVGSRDSLETLIDRGIRTAADISLPVVQNIIGKNSSLMEGLIQWVASLELQFWNSTGHPLDAEEEERIDFEMFRIREDLLRQLATVKQSLASYGSQLQRNQATLLREYETFANDYAVQRGRLQYYAPQDKTIDSAGVQNRLGG